MRTPCRARATPSSTSGTSVMQTGQPGPMITFRSLGNTARRPNRAIACSWLPQTCITLAGLPTSRTARWSAAVRRRARSGSRNFSSAIPGSFPARIGGLDLVAHVGRHQILGLGLAQDGVEERQRLADLVLGDAVDGKPDVVEHVIAGPYGHVDDVQAHLPADAEEIDGGGEPVHGKDLAGNAEAHARSTCSLRGGHARPISGGRTFPPEVRVPARRARRNPCAEAQKLAQDVLLDGRHRGADPRGKAGPG